MILFRRKWPMGSIKRGYEHPFHPIPALMLLALCAITYVAVFLGYGTQLIAMIVFYIIVSLWFHFWRYRFVNRGAQFTMPWPRPKGFWPRPTSWPARPAGRGLLKGPPCPLSPSSDRCGRAGHCGRSDADPARLCGPQAARAGYFAACRGPVRRPEDADRAIGISPPGRAMAGAKLRSAGPARHPDLSQTAPLWLMVTLTEPQPVRGRLHIMARPGQNDSFSRFAQMPVSVPLPPGFPNVAPCAATMRCRCRRRTWWPPRPRSLPTRWSRNW